MGLLGYFCLYRRQRNTDFWGFSSLEDCGYCKVERWRGMADTVLGLAPLQNGYIHHQSSIGLLCILMRRNRKSIC
jgi:hypothetical protein